MTSRAASFSPVAAARALGLYLRPRPLAAFLLGISSGFPLTLLLATMTYWLSKVGVDKKTIGFAVGLTTPYTLKFLWSPLIDRLRLPVLDGLLGQRRSWLFLVGFMLMGALWQLGHSDPAHDLARFATWAIIVSFLSATQDIVIDAYRIEILPPEQLAHGTALNQFGYRTGNLLAGAGTVWLATQHGWAAAYSVTGLLVLCGLAAALWAGDTAHSRTVAEAPRSGEPALDRLGRWFSDTVIGPFAEFFRRNGVSGALLILGFVLIYKLGDAMANVMLSPLIVELGFTDEQYIAANKLVGFWALIAGTALAAPFLSLVGMGRALIITGVLMMVTNLGFAALAMTGNDPVVLGLVIGLENFSSGLGLTVFVTYLSGLSNVAYTATQFALLSSLAAVGRTWLSAPSGILAESLGWVGFYVFTTLIAVPGLFLLWLIWRRSNTGQQPV
ncbi:AmpG family muropeptide MFS transporter [Pedomonas mirosovicensis]|uniref:AmpG family muropeptide MFS transporter n=1 Tax=Pedomonas mirosovicensis TaxID=2908641 RepID=UPI0021684D59|nr:MFS transporter [Pedomonas mirosovicensis]MCH8684193.1 MFS transporter [Pedomonas mirosovicensis]